MKACLVVNPVAIAIGAIAAVALGFGLGRITAPETGAELRDKLSSKARGYKSRAKALLSRLEAEEEKVPPATEPV